ncbi:MAG: glycosyltransferase family 4 protein [Thermoplasmata archaeon]
MNILFMTDTDLRIGRGTENVVLNLIKYKPHDIDIVIVGTDYLPEIRMSDEDYKIILSNSKILKMKHMEFHKNFIMRQYYTIIRKKPLKLADTLNPEVKNAIKNADIIYLFFNAYAFLVENVNVPVIASNHITAPEEIFPTVNDNLIVKIYKKIMFKTYYKNINGFHMFFKNSIVPEMKYNMVLGNGVDTNLFYPDFNVKNKKLKILFVAALVPEKGLDILLPLIDKFKRNDSVEFHIAGGGPMEKEIMKRKNIIFHKSPDNTELSQIYRSCDIFVYPSHLDNFPLVTLEALSSGLFVLAGNFLKGRFDDFENKYLKYIPMNVNSFYDAINEIIENRELIEHDKKLEYEYVKDNYDWSVIAGKFYDYMRKFHTMNKNLE